MVDTQKSRTFGAVVVLVQGAVTALLPRVSVRFIKNAIGKNFHNASELEAKPAYVRQLRAVGVGMVAAAGTDLLLQSAAEDEDDGDDVGAADAADAADAAED
ncbi:hypothetical protein [Halobellus salinus]|uniref:hypothetical protein n=1 Tax=Halobellus salinus TaxID=931585 RepID=UPI00166E9A56|nr:hypothetical protein [Halobellus salinus]